MGVHRRALMDIHLSTRAPCSQKLYPGLSGVAQAFRIASAIKPIRFRRLFRRVPPGWPPYLRFQGSRVAPAPWRAIRAPSPDTATSRATQFPTLSFRLVRVGLSAARLEAPCWHTNSNRPFHAVSLVQPWLAQRYGSFWLPERRRERRVVRRGPKVGPRVQSLGLKQVLRSGARHGSRPHPRPALSTTTRTEARREGRP
jgi:hypothetical protein